MFTWESADKYQRDAARVASMVALADACTPKEFASLRALRDHYEATHGCFEFGLDVRRLRYARWLVEHGVIGEGGEGVEGGEVG